MLVIIPPSPQQVCVIRSHPTHPIKLFPSTMQGFEQVLHVNLSNEFGMILIQTPTI